MIRVSKTRELRHCFSGQNLKSSLNTFFLAFQNKQDKDSAKWEAGAVSNKRQEWRVVADSLKDEWDRHRKQLDDEKKARANAKRQAEFQASNAEKQERREQQAQQGKQAGAETT